MNINISKAEDIQYYMNKLQKDEQNSNIIRSEETKEEFCLFCAERNIDWKDYINKWGYKDEKTNKSY